LISSATLYRHIPELEALGIVEKCEVKPVPYAVEYSMTQAGLELCQVIVRVEIWLRSRLPVSLDPVSQVAWKAATALGEGWAASIMQRLVNLPMSEIELISQVPGLTHYETRGRLCRLVDAGVLDRVPVCGNGKSRYALSEWGRRGVGVLAMAARWENLHMAEQSARATVDDGIAALLVTLPLTCLPKHGTGVCELQIRERQKSVGPQDGTVWVEITDGYFVRSGHGRPPCAPTAWAHGTLKDWVGAVIDRRPRALQRGGD
jgi:DNA-binding HxlR family transcriptional regulator